MRGRREGQGCPARQGRRTRSGIPTVYFIAACVLLLIIAAVTVNAVCVLRVTSCLSDEVSALPRHLPDGSADTHALTARIDGIGDRLASVEPWLNLSVSFRLIDRAQELVDQLKAYAEAGDAGGYAACLASLADAVSDLGRLEHLRAETVF